VGGIISSGPGEPVALLYGVLVGAERCCVWVHGSSGIRMLLLELFSLVLVLRARKLHLRPCRRPAVPLVLEPFEPSKFELTVARNHNGMAAILLQR
jgi:hypothetical protein